MRSELEIRPDDHVQGSAQAPLTLLAYGDYECPYCGQAYYEIQDAQRLLGPALRFAFRNFPLTEIHPNALAAAQVAEAASLQGKFWEVHDALYEHQQELSPRTFLAFAEELGLDLLRFEQDLATARLIRRIERDLTTAEALQLQGTPSFFINGHRYQGLFADGALTLVLQQLLRTGGEASEEVAGRP